MSPAWWSWITNIPIEIIKYGEMLNSDLNPFDVVSFSFIIFRPLVICLTLLYTTKRIDFHMKTEQIY